MAGCCVKTLKTKWDLGLKGGAVIANPIPAEYEMDPAIINSAIESAIQESQIKGIKGKEATPFLLAKVKELTDSICSIDFFEGKEFSEWSGTETLQKLNNIVYEIKLRIRKELKQ